MVALGMNGSSGYVLFSKIFSIYLYTQKVTADWMASWRDILDVEIRQWVNCISDMSLKSSRTIECVFHLHMLGLARAYSIF